MAMPKNTKKLVLEFKMENEKTLALSITDAKDNLAKDTVEATMNLIIEKQAILSGTAAPESIVDAYYVETTANSVLD